MTSTPQQIAQMAAYTMAPSMAQTTTSTSTTITLFFSVYGVTPPGIASPASLTPPACAPIPLFSLAEFSRMRLEHATMQLPDLIHFPFLHGIKGKNDPQCSFASTLSTTASATAGLIQHNASRVIRPRYRRLEWVLCDEDLQVPYICTAPTRSSASVNHHQLSPNCLHTSPSSHHGL